MSTPVTINTGKVNSYIVQQTIGGWVVCWLNEDREIRNVDGGKLHKSRQNAYARAKRLNTSLERALAKTGIAEAIYGGGDYIARVEECDFDASDIDDMPDYKHGYSVMLSKAYEMMPPFETRFCKTIEEVKEYVKDILPLNWHKVIPEEI